MGGSGKKGGSRHCHTGQAGLDRALTAAASPRDHKGQEGAGTDSVPKDGGGCRGRSLFGAGRKARSGKQTSSQHNTVSSTHQQDSSSSDDCMSLLNRTRHWDQE